MTPAATFRHRVMCIGAANIDRKLQAMGALRMGTSNPARQHESFGGVARNIAENLARLGADVSLVTALGGDTAGQALLEHARGAGIRMGGAIVLTEASSGTYTAVLDEAGGMAVALADMDLYERLTPNRVLAALEPAALTVADLNLPHETVAALIRSAHPLVLVAVSESKMARLPGNLAGVRLLILNHGELQARVGRSLEADADIEAACRELREQGVQDVVVTRGGEGVWYTTHDGLAHLPSLPVEVVDVTGAGDAFAAALCWSLVVHGEDLGRACAAGVALAARTVGCRETVWRAAET